MELRIQAKRHVAHLLGRRSVLTRNQARLTPTAQTIELLPHLVALGLVDQAHPFPPRETLTRARTTAHEGAKVPVVNGACALYVQRRPEPTELTV
eukprot:scaffold3275_cov35-Tisochrysis_lutea.AAC.2